MQKIYKEIGEEFEYLGDRYIVVEGNVNCCDKCDMFNYCTPGPENGEDIDDVILLCTPMEREDKKDVYFKKIQL